MRKYYLDNIRWGTVALVVIYHVFYMFNGIVTAGVAGPFHAHQPQDAVQYLLYPWFMMLLFVVSGMCARYYLETHTVREFVRTRTRKLLVPSTIGLLTVGWVQGWFNMALSGAFEQMPLHTLPLPVRYLILSVSGTGVLWFIQLLWLYSMLLALVRRWEKGTLYARTEKAGLPAAALLAAPVWLSGLVLNTPVITVYRFGVYGFTFFLGYFFFAHDAVIERISRFRVPLAVLAAVLGAGYLALHFGDNYAVMPVVGSVSATAFAWCTVLAVLSGMKAWGNSTSPLCRFMAKRSFGLYVFHYLPLSACAYLLRNHTAMPALPCYLLTACAAFGGGLLLYEAVSRVPVLRWCVLGMRREKRDVQGQSGTAA